MTVTDVNVVKSAIFERPDDANKGTLAHCSAFAEATEWQGRRLCRQRVR